MNKQLCVLSEWQVESQTRRIEPHWTESAWFQVWLELARLPHQSPTTVELHLDTLALPVSQDVVKCAGAPQPGFRDWE